MTPLGHVAPLTHTLNPLVSDAYQQVPASLGLTLSELSSEPEVLSQLTQPSHVTPESHDTTWPRGTLNPHT